ncbi:MAG: NAD(P)H-binding protein [Gammaproteobacteria bacterium]
MNTTTRTALVLGTTGGIGGEVTLALLRRGWRVRALHRNPASVRLPDDAHGKVEWVTGDAMKREDVAAAARGVSTIVHAVNPPKYNNWGGLVLPMLDNTIAAARQQGARIVLPGTIYNFGTEAFPILSEYSPQQPHTRKGQIRVEMEERLREAATLGVRTLIVRAGDYFGPQAGNNWFAEGLLAGSRQVRRVLYPGPRELGHSWAYLPDVAETVVRLLDIEERLEAFAVFHFRGHWLERGVEMAETICRVAGLRAGKIFAFPWWAIRIASPFVEVFREMLEMRYLWNAPAELDNTKLRSVIGAEPHTPLEEAVTRVLASRAAASARERTGAPQPVTSLGESAH